MVMEKQETVMEKKFAKCVGTLSPNLVHLEAFMG